MRTSSSKLFMSATVLVSAIVAPVVAEAADSWHQMDTSSNSCHMYVAWPYATSCTSVGDGYRIELNCGLNCWSDTGGVGVAISVGLNYLWTVTTSGQVRYMDVNTRQWADLPMNACGTGATVVPFSQVNGVQILAVGQDASARDVPWIVDAYGTLRYWRTKYNPNCWANNGQVPYDQVGSLGIYDDPNVAFDNTPWIAYGGVLSLKNGSGWDQLSTFTASVASGYNQIIDGAGVLWNYSSTAGFSVDTSFSGSSPVRLSSGIRSQWVKKALVTWNNKVWMFGQ
jgi:hypothetical protein